MSSGYVYPRHLSFDGGGIRGFGSLIMLAEVMKCLPTEEGEEPKPCDHFRYISGAGMGGILAILLGCLRLTVSECMGEYWKLASLITKDDGLNKTSPLFDIKKLEKVIGTIVDKYKDREDTQSWASTAFNEVTTPELNTGYSTVVLIYGKRKDRNDAVCFSSSNPPNDDSELPGLSIPQAAAAVCAAKGIFSEYSVPLPDGRAIQFQDEAYPLGLIDTTELAFNKIKPLSPRRHACISIGSGDIAEDDVNDLLRLAYPLAYVPLLSMFKHYPVLRDLKKRNIHSSKEIVDFLREKCRSTRVSIARQHTRYCRLQFGPVADVGPNDFLSVREVRNAAEECLGTIRRHMQPLLNPRTISTTLHWAARIGDKEFLRDVLSAPLEPEPTDGSEPAAKLEDKDDLGRTPLTYAAENGHAETVELILGESPQSRWWDEVDKSGMTALLYAAQYKHMEAARLLCDSNKERLKLDYPDGMWRSALSYAAENGWLAIMELLPHEEKHLNYRDGHLRTPLSYAAEKGHLEVVEWLLQHNSWDFCPYVTDSKGKTPFGYAKDNNHTDIVDKFQLRNAPVAEISESNELGSPSGEDIPADEREKSLFKQYFRIQFQGSFGRGGGVSIDNWVRKWRNGYIGIDDNGNPQTPAILAVIEYSIHTEELPDFPSMKLLIEFKPGRPDQSGRANQFSRADRVYPADWLDPDDPEGPLEYPDSFGEYSDSPEHSQHGKSYQQHRQPGYFHVALFKKDTPRFGHVCLNKSDRNNDDGGGRENGKHWLNDVWWYIEQKRSPDFRVPARCRIALLISRNENIQLDARIQFDSTHKAREEAFRRPKEQFQSPEELVWIPKEPIESPLTISKDMLGTLVKDGRLENLNGVCDLEPIGDIF